MNKQEAIEYVLAQYQQHKGQLQQIHTLDHKADSVQAAFHLIYDDPVIRARLGTDEDAKRFLEQLEAHEEAYHMAIDLATTYDAAILQMDIAYEVSGARDNQHSRNEANHH